MNPYQVVSDFEKAMAEWTGSPYAVALDSCSNAIFLCCYYLKVDEVVLPSRTYVSVPCSVIHAGGKVKFDDKSWIGSYQLEPYPIWDSACKLQKEMYIPGQFQCISFSANKSLNIGKGGMILTDDACAVKWFKLARYEGRDEVPILEDKFTTLGWNMYMTPEQAARGLLLMNYLSDCEIVTPDYPDLSGYKIYTEANR